MFNRSTQIIFIVLWCAAHVVAQSVQFTVQGEVQDQRGAVIVGAQVTLTDANNHTRATVSDGQGRFRFAGLAGGAHTLRVTAQGFAAVEQEVQSESLTRLTVTLYPRVADAISVNSEGAANALDAQRAAGTQVLTARELEALPDDPDQLGEQLQVLAATAGAAPGQATVTVDGFLNGGRMPPKSAIRE
ncbi:MAG: carboxypeptidase regulatory-like domain-containing protein, partial [Acidobacteria bacterium]|nr:carboxypeptidase regulatory-like domain-containing protein [Acidobacteriota bacterium]